MGMGPGDYDKHPHPHTHTADRLLYVNYGKRDDMGMGPGDYDKHTHPHTHSGPIALRELRRERRHGDGSRRLRQTHTPTHTGPDRLLYVNHGERRRGDGSRRLRHELSAARHRDRQSALRSLAIVHLLRLRR